MRLFLGTMAMVATLVCGAAAAAAAAEGGRADPRPIEPEGWFTKDDYPATARQVRAEGRVVFRLSVDRNGRATGCRVVERSGTDMLDDATCRIAMERARFQPARNAAGRTVPGSFTRTVAWRLAPDGRPLIPFSHLTRVTFDANGRQLDCRTETLGAVPPGVDDPCKGEGRPVGELLPRDRLGRPQAGTLILRLRQEVEGMPLAADGAPLMGDGQRMLTLRRERFTVAADGSVERCDVVEDIDIRHDRALCYLVRGRFLPAGDGGVRRASVVMAMAFRAAR